MSLSKLSEMGITICFDPKKINIDKIYKYPEELLEIGLADPTRLLSALVSKRKTIKASQRLCEKILNKLKISSYEEKISKFYKKVFELKYIPISHYRYSSGYWTNEYSYYASRDAWKYVDLSVKEYIRAVEVNEYNYNAIIRRMKGLGLDPFDNKHFCKQVNYLFRENIDLIISTGVSLETIKRIDMKPWDLVKSDTDSVLSVAKKLAIDKKRIPNDIITWAKGNYLKRKIKRSSSSNYGNRSVNVLEKINTLADLIEGTL